MDKIWGYLTIQNASWCDLLNEMDEYNNRKEERESEAQKTHTD